MVGYRQKYNTQRTINIWAVHVSLAKLFRFSPRSNYGSIPILMFLSLRALTNLNYKMHKLNNNGIHINAHTHICCLFEVELEFQSISRKFFL